MSKKLLAFLANCVCSCSLVQLLVSWRNDFTSLPHVCSPFFRASLVKFEITGSFNEQLPLDTHAASLTAQSLKNANLNESLPAPWIHVSPSSLVMTGRVARTDGARRY